MRFDVLLTPQTVATMRVLPWETLVTSPPGATVATPGAVLLQVTMSLMSRLFAVLFGCVKDPVAVNCSVEGVVGDPIGRVVLGELIANEFN